MGMMHTTKPLPTFHKVLIPSPSKYVPLTTAPLEKGTNSYRYLITSWASITTGPILHKLSWDVDESLGSKSV